MPELIAPRHTSLLINDEESCNARLYYVPLMEDLAKAIEELLHMPLSSEVD